MGVSYIVSVAKDTSGAGNDMGKRLLSGFREGFSRSNGWQDGTDAGTGTEEAQCVLTKRAKKSESWNRIRLGQQWDGLGRLSQCYLSNNFGNSLFFWGQLLLRTSWRKDSSISESSVHYKNILLLYSCFFFPRDFIEWLNTQASFLGIC